MSDADHIVTEQYQRVRFVLGRDQEIRVYIDPEGLLVVRAVGGADRLVVHPEAANAITLGCCR